MKSIILKRVEDALHESEELTQTILDRAFDAIISMDANGEIINWNKRAETIFGWPAHQVIGKNLSETIVPPRHRELHTKGMERFLSTGESRVLNQQIEISALHRDGFEFPIEISISATKWEGSFIFTGIIRDISERKEAEGRARQKSTEYEVIHEIAKKLHNYDSMECMLKEAMQVVTNSKAFDFENFSSVYLIDEENNNFILTATTGIYPETCSEMKIESLINKVIIKKETGYEENSVGNFCLLDQNQKNIIKGLEDKGLYSIPLKWQAKVIGFLILLASPPPPNFRAQPGNTGLYRRTDRGCDSTFPLPKQDKRAKRKTCRHQ